MQDMFIDFWSEYLQANIVINNGIFYQCFTLETSKVAFFPEIWDMSVIF